MSSAWIFDPRNALLVVLAIVALGFIGLVVRAALRGSRAGDPAAPTPGGLSTGFITNFFDTLGIGSFATTTAIIRARCNPAQKRLAAIAFAVGIPVLAIALALLVPTRRLEVVAGVAVLGALLLVALVAGVPVDDRKIPGTLNVGHTLPAIAQAFIFTKLVPVDPKTLVLLILAAVLGAWLGAGVVARWSRRRIQYGMSIALFAAAILLILTLTNRNPTGGTLLELTGTKLAIGFAGNFTLGALMTLGIGLYAPCMIMIYLLGMNPTAAFPIMMGSCAFLMPVASARFIRERGFDLRGSLGLLLGGVPAVLIAAFIVESLPLTAVRWLVLVVVIYTAAGLFRAARLPQEDESPVMVPSGGPTPGTAVP